MPTAASQPLDWTWVFHHVSVVPINEPAVYLTFWLVPHLVTPENKRIKRYIHGLAPQIYVIVATTEPTTIQSVVLKARMLTGEVIKNGLLRKNTKKRGNGKELSRNENVRDDNKRSRAGRAFSIITNPFRKEYTCTTPKCTNCSYHHNLKMPYRKCRYYNHLGHFSRDCRAGPRIVTHMKARNPTIAHRASFECGGTDHYKARGGEFMMEAEEARQDPNIVTGLFILNNHYATTLFDSSANYSFVSTTFITPPNKVMFNLAFGGVTFINISSTKHKERPLG
nr:hypothetical protein [Tanacetum cinerariifolium]